MTSLPTKDPLVKKQKLIRLLVFIALSTALQTCGTTAPAEDVAEDVATGVPLAKRNARELFAFPRVPSFRISMPAERWALLKKNARDEEYVQADAWFEGAPVGKVGIRFKGNVGTLGNCFNEKGEFTCKKLSMKLRFDKYESEKRFFGLKRLNLHSYRWDSSYLKEALAYELFRSMGIVAPRAAWAQLTVNGERLGLFGMVEDIDGRFTADRWPETPDGNLYKEAWPGRSDRAWIVSHLETNEEDADVAAFLAFSDAVAAAKPAELRETLGRFVDLDYMARYMAVDDGIADFDGITAYYASPTGQWKGAGNHNFFFYESAPDRFALIPWDVGSTFDLGGGFLAVPRWTTVPDDCEKRYPVWAGDTVVVPPGCDRVFRALAADLSAYRAAGREFLGGPFSEKSVGETIDRYAAFIRDAVKADPLGPGIPGFDGAVRHLQKQTRVLRLRLESLISEKPTTPLEISAGKILDFESHDNRDLAQGAPLASNDRSVVSVEIDGASPLSGKRDLLYSFRFADEEKGHNQWTALNIPLAPGNGDLSELSGIRFLIRASGERVLRLDIDGPGNPAPESGIRYGWDVDVTENPARMEVRFADASPPSWAAAKGKAPRKLLTAATALIFSPQCRGKDRAGLLGEGNIDAGFIRIDEIELF